MKKDLLDLYLFSKFNTLYMLKHLDIFWKVSSLLFQQLTDTFCGMYLLMYNVILGGRQFSSTCICVRRETILLHFVVFFPCRNTRRKRKLQKYSTTLPCIFSTIHKVRVVSLGLFDKIQRLLLAYSYSLPSFTRMLSFLSCSSHVSSVQVFICLLYECLL